MYYVHTDHLGTPQMITNAAQQIVWEATYKPFGEAIISAANNGGFRVVLTLKPEPW